MAGEVPVAGVRATVTVVVPTWRRPADLARCIEGLEAQSRPPDEVLVVVRHDDGETWSALRDFASDERQVALSPVGVDAAGVAASVNAGLDAATGEIVAVTDDDSVPRPDWVARILEAFACRPDAGGVGGRDWVHEQGRVLDGRRARVGRVLWFGRLVGDHHLGAGGPREVDILKGVNMAFRQRALEGVRIDGGLRGSGMQMHWEIDLCLAVKRAGWKLVYDPAIAVDHFPAPRLDEAQRQELSTAALANEVYNETYALLKGLPLWSKALAFGYGLIVGTRQAPGPVSALERRLRGVSVGAALVASSRARGEALAAYLRHRNAGRGSR